MAQAAASTCEICTGGPGEHYCQQCDQLFCGSCKISHLRAQSCKNHTFVNGQDINKEEKLLCTEHNEGFLFYCQDCDIPVCRICSVEKHSRHLMIDLTKSIETFRSELIKIIESKVTTSRQNISKMEMQTKTYREIVKTVTKTITDEGKYWKQLIDKKVEDLIKLVHDQEKTEIQHMSGYSEVYKSVVENCQTLQENMKKIETKSEALMLKKLKQLKTDVDEIVLKQIPDAPIAPYKNKKPSDTEIDHLFGKLQFLDSKATIDQTHTDQTDRMQVPLREIIKQQQEKALQMLKGIEERMKGKRGN